VLQPGESLTQTPSGASGRYQAYWSMSDIGAKYGLFEYTVCGDGLCCNPSHVDVFTMPITLSCAADGLRTGCTKNPSMDTVRAALASCPTAQSEFGAVSDSRFCYSAGYACAVNSGVERCGYDAAAPMQRAMRQFGGSGSSRDAYLCAGPFAEDSTGCAKLHRGVQDPTGADPSSFYQLYEDGSAVFNEYSKWLHDLCGDNDYAFPYDDNGGHGGYQGCGGDVTVTFCSKGSSPTPSPTPIPQPIPQPNPQPSPQPSPCPVPPGTVMFKNKALQLCMAGDDSNGTPIHVRQCNGYEPSLRWFVNTYDKHISMKSSSCEDMCLDVPDNDAKNGKKLQVWQCNANAPQQKWDVESNHKVYLSGTNYCLDVGSSSPQLWTCDYASAFMDNQYWDRETSSTDVMLNATHEQQREMAEGFIV